MLSLGLIAMLTGILTPIAYGQSLAPDFTLTDIDGTSFSLSDYRGHVVLLEFMRTWCSKCQIEVSELVEVQNEFGDLITIISLGIDANETNEDLRQFRDSEGSWWWPPHAGGSRSDEIMSAPMPNLWQGIIFSQKGQVWSRL